MKKRMKELLAVLLFALALVVPSYAQDETPGQQSKIVASVPVGGFNCGRASTGVNCFSVPANIGGSFWIDAVPTAYVPHGFIYFFNVADLGQATITKQTFTVGTNHIVTLHVEFNGLTNDGDGDTYTGTGDFTFSYYKVSSGSGRGGGYPGYIQVLQSGSLVITYN